MTLPVYLIASPEAPARALVGALGEHVRRIGSVEDFRALDGNEPGLLLMDRETVSADDQLDLAESLAEDGPGWIVAMVSDAEAPLIRTISVGKPHTPEEVAARVSAPDDAHGVLLELEGVLSEIARVRHDLNNPLTSALAEVQLLLFDVTDEEERESLEVMQEQLRRMRDMIASTKHLRPRRR
jgi:signal transduction histidine kinase